ncbi:MAG: TRIC cation channel family protein [Acidobacteriota bacterium]
MPIRRKDVERPALAPAEWKDPRWHFSLCEAFHSEGFWRATQPPLVDTANLFRLVHFFDIVAAVVFAVSGALVASRKGLDVMGFMCVVKPPGPMSSADGTRGLSQARR